LCVAHPVHILYTNVIFTYTLCKLEAERWVLSHTGGPTFAEVPSATWHSCDVVTVVDWLVDQFLRLFLVSRGWLLGSRLAAAVCTLPREVSASVQSALCTQPLQESHSKASAFQLMILKQILHAPSLAVISMVCDAHESNRVNVLFNDALYATRPGTCVMLVWATPELLRPIRVSDAAMGVRCTML